MRPEINTGNTDEQDIINFESSKDVFPPTGTELKHLAKALSKAKADRDKLKQAIKAKHVEITHLQAEIEKEAQVKLF